MSLKSFLIGFLYGALFSAFVFTALNLVHDEPRQTVFTSFNCIPDNEASEARVTLVEGKPFCTKHERLTVEEQRRYLNKIWPMVSAEWNSSK